MSRASVLARGRAAALAGMIDTCRITRVISVVTDPDTGVQTPTIETVYEGVCRVQQHVPGGARPVDAGEAFDLLLRLELQLPISAVGIAPSDSVEMLTCANDPDLIGRELRVRELGHKSEATARRIGVEEATS